MFHWGTCQLWQWLLIISELNEHEQLFYENKKNYCSDALGLILVWNKRLVILMQVTVKRSYSNSLVLYSFIPLCSMKNCSDALEIILVWQFYGCTVYKRKILVPKYMPYTMVWKYCMYIKTSILYIIQKLCICKGPLCITYSERKII